MTQALQGANTYTYAYNGLGDRLSQTLNGTTTTHYVNDTAAGLTQVLSDGTDTYLYGLSRIAQQPGTNGMQYFGVDGLDSVRQLYNSSGQVVANTRYDPYGNVMSQSGTGTSVYGFAGELTDATGLVDLRARYYDPMQGRFTSQDTWQGDYNTPLTLNKWNYTNGNPVNYTDPNGQDPWWCDSQPNSTECWVSYTWKNAGKPFHAYSYTELVYKYTGYVAEAYGWRKADGSYHAAGLDLGDQWWQAHALEWNGDWGTISTSMGERPYEPAVGEELAMLHTLDQQCAKTDIQSWGIEQLAQALPFIAPGVAVGLVMVRGPNGALGPVYCGGESLEVRPGEVRIDKATGLVRTDRGVSLNINPAEVEKFGGAYPVESIPDGLKIIQQGTRDPGHYEIVAAYPMTLEHYQELLSQVKLAPRQ